MKDRLLKAAMAIRITSSSPSCHVGNCGVGDISLAISKDLLTDSSEMDATRSNLLPETAPESGAICKDGFGLQG